MTCRRTRGTRSRRARRDRTSGRGRCRRRPGCGSAPCRRRGTMSPWTRGYPLAMRTTEMRAHDERRGLLAAAGAAILYGAAYPATAVALRSFTPLGDRGHRLHDRAARSSSPPRSPVSSRGRDSGRCIAAQLTRLVILAALGGLGFIAAVEHRGVAERLDRDRVRRTALRGGGGPPRDPDPRRAHPAGDRRGIRARPRRDVAPRRGRPDARDAGRRRDGRRGGGHVRAVHGPRPSVERPLRRSTARSSPSPTSSVAVPILLAVEFLRSPGTVIPTDPDPAAVVALLSIAFGSSSTANLLLMASVRRVPARRTSAVAAPDADLLGGHRGHPARRPTHPAGPGRGRPHPARDRRRQRPRRPTHDAGPGVIRRAWQRADVRPGLPRDRRRPPDGHDRRAWRCRSGRRWRSTLITFALLFDYSRTFLPDDVVALGRAPDGHADPGASSGSCCSAWSRCWSSCWGSATDRRGTALTFGEWRWGLGLMLARVRRDDAARPLVRDPARCPGVLRAERGIGRRPHRHQRRRAARPSSSGCAGS